MRTMRLIQVLKRIGEWVTLGVILCGLCLWLTLNALLFWDIQARETFKVVWKGMREEEMIKRMEKLGISCEAVYTKENAPKHYYLEDFSYKERPITNKVYIYTYGNFVAYYWIDKEGKVEDVYIGGT